MTIPILTAAQVRAAEERAIAAGTPVEALMETAGHGVAEAAWRFAGPVRTLVLCGPGNNGGDGYEIARLGHGAGLDVELFQVGAAPGQGAAAAARQGWLAGGGAATEYSGQALRADVVVDVAKDGGSLVFRPEEAPVLEPETV